MHVAWDKTRNLLPRGEERWQMVVVREKNTMALQDFVVRKWNTPEQFTYMEGGLLLKWSFALGGYCKYEDEEWTAVHSEEEGRE